MAHCVNCTAPLPAHTGRCSYCGTRNDLDFAAVERYAVSLARSQRTCPDCAIPLQSISLEVGERFAIDRCERCFGLFFDPGEIQAFLEAAVAPVFEIDYRQIASISEERGGRRQVRYIKCPECGTVMNRRNFGTRSGVVVDQCRAHGIWLDNGEIVQLLEWRRAGGQLLSEQRAAERRREEERAAAAVSRGHPAGETFSAEVEPAWAGEPLDEVIRTALDFVGRLFR